jgi:carbamoyl-phosphate synthase large subunit
MEKLKITIAVKGLNNTDNPGPGVPVIRGIRDSEVIEARIIGLAYENLEPGVYMPGLINKTYMIPYPSTGTEAYVERIEEIHQKDPIDLIIPNLDAELYTFMKASSKLSEIGIKTFLPSLEQFEERHKANLDSFGIKYDVKVPKSKTLTGQYEIEKLSDDFEYPVLVKGKFYDAYIAYNPEQVTTHFNKISAKWGIPIIIQEFIKGTEVNVVALGDGMGSTIAAVPMRKQFITDKGKAWSGITISDTELLGITNGLIEKTKWRGAMEIEMIKTNAGEYYLIEINPRIPAWVYLAVGAGQNIPETLVKLAMGKSVTPYKMYQTGKMFIRYSWDLLGDIQEFEQLSIYGELEKQIIST